MHKAKIVTAAGVAAATLAMLPLGASAATSSALFQPIPNASAGDAQMVKAQYYYHHRYGRYYGYHRYGYYRYGRPYWWRRHHHHHRYDYDRRWY
jgi:hypothetical protein